MINVLFGPSSPFCPIYIVGSWVIYSLYQKYIKLKNECQKTYQFSVANQFLDTYDKFKSSIKMDIFLTCLNMVMFRGPILWIQAAIFVFCYDFTQDILEQNSLVITTYHWPWLCEAIFATIISTLSYDFAAFLVHWLMHHNRYLWRIHRVHHSAQILTPLTTFRQNPLEPLILYAARGLATGVTLGFFHAYFDQETPVITFWGMGIGFFAYMFTIHLHHLPIPIKYPRLLTHFFISPHIHHLHHSSAYEHHNINFGVMFTFWDRLFGTYYDQNVNINELEFGLEPTSRPQFPHQRLVQDFPRVSR